MEDKKNIFNEITLRDEIEITWGKAGAHMDVYMNLLRKIDKMNTTINQAIDALQNVDTAVKIGGMIPNGTVHNKVINFLQQQIK